MIKKTSYWFTVGIISYITVILIDTYSYLLTHSKVQDSVAIIEVSASDNVIQLAPNYSITSVFNTISTQQLFVPELLSIMSIDVINAPIDRVGVNDNGSMNVPSNPNVVGWYKNGALGGEIGNVVLAGHYDWYNGTKGVFYRLNSVKIGDLIEVIANDISKTYVVYETKYVPNNDISAVDEAFRQTSKQELTLITCGGVWNNILGSYDKRFLVKAVLEK